MKVTLEEAQRLILDEQIVALPTDTVYGLAVLPSVQEKLYWFKGRPAHKKFIRLVANVEQVIALVGDLEGLREMANDVWPGPTTLILPAGEETLGFRIPAQPEVCELLERTGPLCVPSANLHGEPPATTASEVEGYFGEEFPILEGEERCTGEPSEIIDFTTHAVIR